MTTIRRPGAASAAVLVGLTASLFAAHLIAPDWSRRAGLDVWNLAELEQYRQAIAEEQADLDANEDRFHQRVEAADHVATRLIAGTISLSAAADELAAIFRHCPDRRQAFELIYPGTSSERHLYACHAIERATRLLADPAKRDTLRARLESEYREMSSGQ